LYSVTMPPFCSHRWVLLPPVGHSPAAVDVAAALGALGVRQPQPEQGGAQIGEVAHGVGRGLRRRQAGHHGQPEREGQGAKGGFHA
jgi:hypothetical protein